MLNAYSLQSSRTKAHNVVVQLEHDMHVRKHMLIANALEDEGKRIISDKLNVNEGAMFSEVFNRFRDLICAD
jgi:hypothetical protein